jgi:predicted ABC-type sugar transport system permease subunit
MWAAVAMFREKVQSVVAFIDRSPEMIEQGKKWFANLGETTKDVVEWLPFIAVGIVVLWWLAKSR